MFDWVQALVLSKQDDFWLNVLAGIPFLVFEVVIITLILPFALQWRDERRWLETRLVAVNNVLDRYADIDEIISALLEVEGPEHDHVHQALRRHLVRMDTALQTALPVLSPEMSRDLLQFHYQWSAFIDTFRANKFEVSSSGGEVSRIIYLALTVNEVALQHRALKVRYVKDASWLSVVRIGLHLPFERFGELVAKIELEALAKRGREPPENLDEYVSFGRASRRALLLSREAAHPIVLGGWFDRLRKPSAAALYLPSQDERRRIFEDYAAFSAIISERNARQVDDLMRRGNVRDPAKAEA